jgi:hypothetical protein
LASPDFTFFSPAEAKDEKVIAKKMHKKNDVFLKVIAVFINPPFLIVK